MVFAHLFSSLFLLIFFAYLQYAQRVKHLISACAEEASEEAISGFVECQREILNPMFNLCIIQ